MNVIECAGLTKSYRNTKAIKDLSFTIEENKITGLIGRNGAGKTTLLKTLAGFYERSSGDIKVFGEEPFNSLKVSSNMIFIDDQMIFPNALPLVEILECASTFYNHWNMKIAKGLFEYFSFHKNQYHNDLSKGMKSTFNMIIGLASRCPLTIFDEPTTGMDAAVRKDFYRALLKDYIDHPRTIILSSHLLNEIEDLLEDVLLLREGTIRLHMPVLDLKEYAVGLLGKMEAIEPLVIDKELFYRESVGINTSYIVIRNDLNDADRAKILAAGIEIKSVSTNDICVYLTSKTKGGIDDVFNTK
ncbi:ABC transporter [Desulfuribacillus stibiiarsenatis]|uniref:ABC transporter n=1 Tax=Desulfuribacillus stibiiarsenatis TaxID=1390249 RepID=A0A1E5L532_9FIRM|nr:ABC transporter ATP-binding protein [Desulfuribacillus stibiiarsenatis]OEH85079.1 ABC transporter [Desulfuribacillus stibiiarsenatis]